MGEFGPDLRITGIKKASNLAGLTDNGSFGAAFRALGYG